MTVKLLLYFICLIGLISSLVIQNGEHGLQVTNKSEFILSAGSETYSLKPLYVAELTSDDKEITTSSGEVKRTNLNEKSFDFSSIATDTSEPATFKQFSLHTKLYKGNSSAVMTVLVKNFFRSGKVTNLPFGETATKIGTTEIKINLDNYTFCQKEEGNCFVGVENVSGEFLDLGIGLSGVQGEVMHESKAFSFRNGKLAYTEYVDVNANLKMLEAGYPKLTKSNNQYVIILRFRKANDLVSSFKYSHLIADVIKITRESSISRGILYQPISASVSQNEVHSQIVASQLPTRALINSGMTSCSLSHQTVYLVTRVLRMSQTQQSSEIKCTNLSSAKTSATPRLPSSSASSRTADSYVHSSSSLTRIKSPKKSPLSASENLGPFGRGIDSLTMRKAPSMITETLESSGYAAGEETPFLASSVESSLLGKSDDSRSSVSLSPVSSKSFLNVEGFLKTISVDSESPLASEDVNDLSKETLGEILSSRHVSPTGSIPTELSTMSSAILTSVPVDDPTTKAPKTTELHKSTQEKLEDVIIVKTPFLTNIPSMVSSGQVSLSKQSSSHLSTAAHIKCFVTTVTLGCSQININTSESMTNIKSVFASSASEEASRQSDDAENLTKSQTNAVSTQLASPEKTMESFTIGRYFPPLSARSSVSPSPVTCKGTSSGGSSICSRLVILSIIVPFVLAMILASIELREINIPV